MAVVGLPFWKTGYWVDDFWAAGFWIATVIPASAPHPQWVLDDQGTWLLVTVETAQSLSAERWIEDPDKNWQLRTV